MFFKFFKKKRKTKKEPLNKLDKYLIFSIVVLVIYAIAEMIVSCISGYERSTLTSCFYAAFGGEIFSCVVIKVFKLKHDPDENENEGGEG